VTKIGAEGEGKGVSGESGRGGLEKLWAKGGASGRIFKMGQRRKKSLFARDREEQIGHNHGKKKGGSKFKKHLEP